MRKYILITLLRLDNFLRRWITYFSLEQGVHPKHRLTQYHQFFLDNIFPTDSVLDVGCGLGLLACDIAAKAKHVTGIDLNKDYLSQAHRLQNIDFIHGDATTFDFKKNFDVLILSNTLEHIKNRVDFLKKLTPHAKKFLVRVPMINRDWLVLLKKELGVEYRLDPTHYIEYTEEIFRRELAAAGLEITKLSVRFGEIYCCAQPNTVFHSTSHPLALPHYPTKSNN
ncbi:MAG: class I SAM-dependent methyltransferase [bacterium]